MKKEKQDLQRGLKTAMSNSFQSEAPLGQVYS